MVDGRLSDGRPHLADRSEHLSNGTHHARSCRSCCFILCLLFPNLRRLSLRQVLSGLTSTPTATTATTGDGTRLSSLCAPRCRVGSGSGRVDVEFPWHMEMLDLHRNLTR